MHGVLAGKQQHKELFFSALVLFHSAMFFDCTHFWSKWVLIQFSSYILNDFFKTKQKAIKQLPYTAKLPIRMNLFG